MESLDVNPKLFKSFFSRFINQHVDGTGLRESQIIFLTVLDEKNGMSLKEMTEKVGVNKSLTTRAVKHLIDSGFVINIADSGKEHSIILTERGKDAKETVMEAFEELFSLIFEDLTDDELMQMKYLLSKIKHKMEELSSRDGD